MRAILVKATLVGTLLFSFSGTGLAHRHHGGGDAAIVAGGLLLGAAALAASSNDHHHRDQYFDEPDLGRSAYPVAPFSPARGVLCYPSESACYDNDGDFLPTWTARVF